MLTIHPDEQAVAEAAAERLTTLVEEAIAARGTAVVSLTGGQTPRRLYALVADASRPWRRRMAWDRVHLFWGDERHVPPDHQESNYGMARETLLAHVPVPPAQVHRMRGEFADARAAAAAYETALRDGFTAAGRRDLTFDVMLLGLGEDAHLASIFPDSPLLDESLPRAVPGLAAGIWAPHLHAWRITLTPPAIVDARRIVMVVAGARKADAVHAALEAPLDVRRHPAQLLRGAGERVDWILDRPAAARLPPR